jgi:hypothetical protein
MRGVVRAHTASALDHPLHADIPLLAEFGRNVLLCATRQRLRRGSFRSIGSLQAAINQYLDQRSAELRPFVWTAPATYILAKLSELPVASE